MTGGTSARTAAAQPERTGRLPKVVVSRSAPLLTADALTMVALLNCLAREIAVPAGDLHPIGTDWVEFRLPRSRQRFRARLLRPLGDVSRGTMQPRFAGEVRGADGQPLTWRDLLEVAEGELCALAGSSAGHLVEQVAASHRLIEAALRREPVARTAVVPAGVDTADPASVYLDLEQSLLAGHRHHPAPKARSGAVEDILRHAPELGASFQLHRLAVRNELVRQVALTGFPAEADDLDESAPSGYRVLPLHPWQFRILTRTGALSAALQDGRAIDLGPAAALVRPTSSVRTVAVRSGFLKLSLSVLITNCLRINPWSEVRAAVLLSELLDPLRRELADRFPGTVVLRETVGTTADLGLGLVDQLGSIRREGLTGHLTEDLLPVPAAALTEPRPHPIIAALLTRITADRRRLLRWWAGYLRAVLPPVLHAYARHAVVFEAHLQNVVLGLDRDGFVAQVVLRDLEGVKLVRGRWPGDPTERIMPTDLADRVRAHVVTSPRRGWARVAYCLLVNHVGGLIDTLADHDPDAEPALWTELERALSRVEPFPELDAVLAGGPVPAKTNLLTRWTQAADRDSAYVALFLPFGAGGQLLTGKNISV